jgi:2-polyprenyl-3-methyl-5-hydroxy-6-metoxy-1,4-benzoquinol methylase
MEKKIQDSRLRYHELGFLEIANPPSPETLKAYYAERYYQTEQGSYQKTYSDEERTFINLKIVQKASLVDRLRGKNIPGSFLDVGCGEGFALAWFAAAGWSVEGIDYSIAGLESMNPDFISHVECGDLFEILERRISGGERHDIVWLTNVLEHVINPVNLLKSFRHLVAPDGILVVTVPNDGSTYQEFLLDNGYIPHRFWIAIPDHLAYFTYESLARTAEATGWKCREIIGDFPIDFFLLHSGSNYVRDRANGPLAHQARIELELMLSNNNSQDTINEFYRSLARVGLGRDLTAFLSPQ